MPGKDTTKSTFNQLFRPICSERFHQQIAELEVDKYVKKFFTLQLIELMAHAQLEQQRALRDVSNSLNDDQISAAIRLKSISASQISRRLRDLPTEVLQSLFNDVNVVAHSNWRLREHRHWR